MEKKLLFYGCMRSKGHHLFDSEGWYSIRGKESEIFSTADISILRRIDGAYTPKDTAEGFYKETNEGGFLIVAWWDYTIDDRPGSNSNLIGYGYNSAEDMINDAYRIFPSVMQRQCSRPTPAEMF